MGKDSTWGLSYVCLHFACKDLSVHVHTNPEANTNLDHMSWSMILFGCFMPWDHSHMLLIACLKHTGMRSSYTIAVETVQLLNVFWHVIGRTQCLLTWKSLVVVERRQSCSKFLQFILLEQFCHVHDKVQFLSPELNVSVCQCLLRVLFLVWVVVIIHQLLFICLIIQRHEDTVWDSASRYWAHWPSEKKSGSASPFHFSSKISLCDAGNFSIKLLLLIFC